MSKPLFAQPEIAKAFEDYNRLERRKLFKIICWVAIFAMPAGISLDMQVYPKYVPLFLELRLISSVVVAALFAFFYSPWGRGRDRFLFLILPMIPIVFIAGMIYATDGPLSPYYAGLNVVLVVFCLLVPWNYQETLAVCTYTFVIYVAACLAHGGVVFGGIFFNNLYFLFLTATFNVIGTSIANQLRVREFTLRFELDQNKRKLEESNQKLIALDEMKSRFFANISHELRTPLTLIIGPLESLQREKAGLLDEESRNILQIMSSNAMRLLKLINDLLDLVKLESGRIEIRREAVDLKEFVRGMIQSIQNTAKDKRVKLSANVDESVKRVMADRDKLEKIILNLLFNALKFTPAGGQVELTAQKEENRLVIHVRDTGMGISEENLPHIFDRFWQADASANRKYQGTGIGLALVKELAEAQDGTVGVESQLSRGTTMTIRLPYIEAVDSEAPVEESRAPETTAAEPDEWLANLYRRAELFPTLTPVSATMPLDNYARGKKPKLLLADDEPDMLRFLKSQLEKDYEIIESVDGNQAVAKAKQFLPDVALLDMMMPEKDGIAACYEIKTNLATQSIPVILLTARADDATKLAALNAGASDFLTKPFSTTELHVRIKNLMDSHHFQSELARQNQRLESAMEQLKETEATLVQTEKMSSLGRMSAGMIHEINNPLNYALAALNVLKAMREKWPEAEKAKIDDLLSDMHEGMARVQTIVSDLRSFTHPHGRAADLIELDEVISIALRFLGHEIEKEVAIEVNVPKGQRAAAEKNNLTHVFINLFQNAVDAMKAKKNNGEKRKLSIRSEAGGETVKIWVRDNGTGISPEHLGKIFDPFFTTKDVGAGMGLGLSICYRIMAEQGGKISVKSEPGQFTEFLLELPLKIIRSGS